MAEIRIGSLCSGSGALDMAAQAVFGGSVAWHAETDPDAGLMKGTADARWLWPQVARAIGDLRPRYVLLENVAALLVRGGAGVLADLAALGFDAEWRCLRASAVGAPHRRERIFILAWPTDTEDVGRERCGRARDGRSGPADGRGRAAADADVLVSRDDGELQAGRDTVQRGLRADAAGRGTSAPDAAGAGLEARRQGRPGGGIEAGFDWGDYGPAIAHWAAILGRPAPTPVDEIGRLDPLFVEWHMGMPAGHVTDTPGLSRNAQLRILGNGVVPHQAIAAGRELLARATA